MFDGLLLALSVDVNSDEVKIVDVKIDDVKIDGGMTGG
jgi:hypothetical protein